MKLFLLLIILLWQMVMPRLFAAGRVDDARSIEYPTGIRAYTPTLLTNGLSNVIGFDEALSYVSDLQTTWDYSSLYYYRTTDKGTFGGRVNSAHRFATTALQYQIEAYPTLFRGAYAALSFAYANTTQTLYPSYQYRAEGYFTLPCYYEFSLGQGGQKFPRFSNKQIFSYTSSLGKYKGDYFMWIRTYYYTPRSNLLGELGLRKTFADPNTYIGMRISAGTLPDIGDLPPLDNLVTVDQKAVGVNGQFLLSHNFYAKVDISYAHQLYPAGLVRNITAGFVGIFVKF